MNEILPYFNYFNLVLVTELFFLEFSVWRGMREPVLSCRKLQGWNMEGKPLRKSATQSQFVYSQRENINWRINNRYFQGWPVIKFQVEVFTFSYFPFQLKMLFFTV